MLTRKMLFSIIVFTTCFVSLSALPLAADKPTESDVQQIALKAAALVKDKGIEAARDAFNVEGEFKYGEIYVNVMSDKGIRLIYPPTPAVVNVDVLEAQDVDGKYMIKDILEVARAKGEGWTQYRWTNPTTKKIAEKMTYVKYVPERGSVVYVGVYK
jgi:signal transduction histidine kinase